MQLEYDLTHADFAEAQAVIQAAALRHRPITRIVLTIWNLAWIVVCSVLFAMYASQPGGIGRSPVMACLLLPLAPWAALLGTTIMVAYFRLRVASIKPWEVQAVSRRTGKTRSRWVRLLINAVMLAYWIVIAFQVQSLIERELRAGQSPQSQFGYFMIFGVAIAVSAAILHALWAHTTNLLRGSASGSWELQSHLHGHHVVRVEETGVDVQTPLLRTDYSWRAFVGFTEAQTVFLLFISATSFLIIPKRSLTGPVEMDTFCAAISREIPAGRLLVRATGFPVGPVVATPPPLPTETRG
ncbi:MAG TPA: YcxB family protein [Humisphaera sp.]|jgi:hypothetical protein|nr:YcxB family protein [Humisphaera sp.]